MRATSLLAKQFSSTSQVWYKFSMDCLKLSNKIFRYFKNTKLKTIKTMPFLFFVFMYLFFSNLMNVIMLMVLPHCLVPVVQLPHCPFPCFSSFSFFIPIATLSYFSTLTTSISWWYFASSPLSHCDPSSPSHTQC